jgi:L-threonylcarbamoyladenylate synthase
VTPEDVEAFEGCIQSGGVAVFPADTVYGLATGPESREGFDRLYRLKGRAPDKPSAVMFFQLEAALAALPELGERTRAAVGALLPGPVTVVLPNPAHRFPLACGTDPDRVGLRVPILDGALAPLAGMRLPVLQSSANLAGRPDARRVEDIAPELLAGADVVLDGGELPGTPSTVVDLSGYEAAGDWSLLREGAVPRGSIAGSLS